MKKSLQIYFYYILFSLIFETECLKKEETQVKNDSIKTLALLYNNIYNNKNNTVFLIMNKFKTELEAIPNFHGLIFNRIKSPLSIYKKFINNENYQKNWNDIKDLLGFMIIVDTHNEIDDIIIYLKNRYLKFKNENSENFVNDFRKRNIRNKKEFEFYEIKNNYQLNNGYKTVRLNLMYEEYPIEIQIKTKEEYIAHKTTHDLIYKSDNIFDLNKKYEISDAVFPLIEVLSHKYLNQYNLTTKNLEELNRDLKLILERNKNIYYEFKNIIDSSLEISAIYIFIFNNKKYFNYEKSNENMNERLIECNILKVIKYLTDKSESILNSDFSISSIVHMNYSEFQIISSKLENLSLLDSISIYSINDIIRNKDLNLIHNLSKCYKKIHFGIYNDELSELFLGHKTLFPEKERIKNIQSIKNIYDSGIIDNSGNLVIQKNHLNISENKAYKLCYLPGVFDMYHPGHRIYIEKTNELCSNIIIGLKSLNYSRQYKNKEPIFNETERKSILLNVKGIKDVHITNFDIQPDNKTLSELLKYSPKSAIFLGSDWKSCQHIMNYIDINLNNNTEHIRILNNLKFDKFCKKPKISLEQYIYLKKNFHEINLIMIERENSLHSSTGYRNIIKQNINQMNHFEIKDYVNI